MISYITLIEGIVSKIIDCGHIMPVEDIAEARRNLEVQGYIRIGEPEHEGGRIIETWERDSNRKGE